MPRLVTGGYTGSAGVNTGVNEIVNIFRVLSNWSRILPVHEALQMEPIKLAEQSYDIIY